MIRSNGVAAFEAGGVPFSMRRTDQDRKPPRRVLTAVLLGDPRPDRLERAEALRRMHERSGAGRRNYPMQRAGGGRD